MLSKQRLLRVTDNRSLTWKKSTLLCRTMPQLYKAEDVTIFWPVMEY